MSEQPILIDFHMHAFPEAIAERSIQKLEQISQSHAYTRGTVSETLSYMKTYGITAGVLMQIATKPSQQHTINNWAKQVQEENDALYCFGSVHPDAPDAVEELYRIRELGLKGVKFHPDYQNFFVDEERMTPLYETIAKLELPVLFHAGWDPLSPDVVHTRPQALAKVAEQFPTLTMIGAHMGGMKLADEVCEHLLGKPVYLDFSMAIPNTPLEQLEQMIKTHGTDRILFATDCPWGNAGDNLEALRSMGLTPGELEQILSGNAKTLLHL